MGKPIRVCRICEQFPPLQGGLSSGMLDLSLAQHERGHDVTVITRHETDAEKMDARLPFQVIRIAGRSSLRFGFKAYKTMAAIKDRPHVVHTHGPAAFTCLLNKKNGDPPFVHTAHAVRKYQYSLFRDLPAMVKTFEATLGEQASNPPRFYGPFTFYVQKEIFLEKQVFRKADHILVVADYFADQINAYYGVPFDRITAAYNGSNFDQQKVFDADLSILDNMAIGNKKEILLYVGRVDWVKRVHLLVQAMPSVLEHFPNACLLIAGKGDQAADLMRLVRKLNLEDSVKLPGWIPHEKLAALYKVAKCFCLPSYWEGLSKSLLEAMSAGIPVVASDNLANREALQNGRYGWLIKEATSKAWSTTIIDILSNSSDAHAKVDAARELLDNKFRWNQVAERVETAYANVIKAYD